MDDNQSDIVALQHAVESKYDKVLKTTNDFNKFSLFLREQFNEFISASTLKRLWNYVSYPHNPRLQTLDCLSRFLGYADFKAFCDRSSDNEKDEGCSLFLSLPIILSNELVPGEEIELGWMPDRYMRLTYCGDNIYEVKDVRQSKFQPGDRFRSACFLLGQPLVVPYIVRDGNRTCAFVAGRNGGLTFLNHCKK